MGTRLVSELSERDLDLMERRSQAASPGPWISFVVGRDLEAGLNCIEVGYTDVMELLGGTVADQDFVASAREDMPRLISEVRRLRTEMKVRAMVLSSVTASQVATSNAAAASAAPVAS
jgi:hypothetical protein